MSFAIRYFITTIMKFVVGKFIVMKFLVTEFIVVKFIVTNFVVKYLNEDIFLTQLLKVMK